MYWSPFAELMDTYLLAMQDAEQFLTFLHSLSDMGAAMRRVMAKALINEEVYRTLTTLHAGKCSLAQRIWCVLYWRQFCILKELRVKLSNFTRHSHFYRAT